MAAVRQETVNSNDLINAFHAFSQNSTALSDTYKSLESRINILTKKLTDTNECLANELAENKILSKRMERIINALPVGIIVLNKNDEVIEWNSLAERCLSTRLSGQAWKEIENIILSKGVSEGNDTKFDNGKVVRVSIQLLTEGGRLIVLQDVTEERKIQKDIHEKERFVEVGEMTAGLIHQIRTPLSSAILYLESLASSIEISNESRSISGLEKSLKFINKTVNDLMLYAGRQKPDSDTVLLGDFISGIQAVVRDELDRHGAVMEVVTDIPGCCLKINKNSLLGAFNSLITNSLQAGANRITIALSSQGSKIQFLIADNGFGMSVDEQKRVFSPFFTTKMSGNGIGLSIVKTLIELDGGNISLKESGFKKGTCFDVMLPIAIRENVALKSNYQ